MIDVIGHTDRPPADHPLSARPWVINVAAAVLLAWYYVSSLSALTHKCTTYDEVLHLTGGYSYWITGDFRVQPENGNLPQRWAALPLLLTKPRFPELNQEAWRLSDVGTVGDQFFYDLGNDADAVLLQGRAMMGLMGVALGALIFVTSRRLWGAGPALLSLTLFAFCPTVLANGPLITSDMTAALFFLASVLCIWRVLHRVSVWSVAIGGLCMSGLFLAKFSAFIIVPIGLMLLAIRIASHKPVVITLGPRTWEVCSRGQRAWAHGFTIGVYAVVVWAMIWVFYDFRFDMFARVSAAVETNVGGAVSDLAPRETPWNEFAEDSRTVMTLILIMRDAHVLPEAYLYGFAYTWYHAQERSAFLNGDYSLQGWPQFFPYCVSVKTPLALFVLMAFAIAALFRNWCAVSTDWKAQRRAMVESLYRTAPIWTLFGVYWAFAIASHINIGHRHILPTYPAMLMLAGGAGLWVEKNGKRAATPVDARPAQASSTSSRIRWAARNSWPAIVVVVCVALFAADSLWRWPNYLAYFNQLAGGPSHAYRHLVDSSLDWGQDLPALKDWLDNEKHANRAPEKTYLSYFGCGKPSYYGIDAILLPCLVPRPENDAQDELKPGTYCISATMLQSVYLPFRGRWTRQYEDEYRSLVATVRRYRESTPQGREQLLATDGREYWANVNEQYVQARVARLNSYLRQREPDDEINYSILVYRLSKADLIHALEGEPVELDDK